MEISDLEKDRQRISSYNQLLLSTLYKLETELKSLETRSTESANELRKEIHELRTLINEKISQIERDRTERDLQAAKAALESERSHRKEENEKAVTTFKADTAWSMMQKVVWFIIAFITGAALQMLFRLQ